VRATVTPRPQHAAAAHGDASARVVIDVKETAKMVVDRLKGHVFVNQYLIIQDLGRGAHGAVKLVYNTDDDRVYAMKVRGTCMA
jgi:hypothetical protein